MAGILRQRQVKLQAEPDENTGVTLFAIEIMEPVSFADQISHNQTFLQCARDARWRVCFGCRVGGYAGSWCPLLPMQPV